MTSKISSVSSNNLQWNKSGIQLPAEHGAVITFLLGLFLSCNLSADRLLSSAVSVLFLIMFCSYRNLWLRRFSAVCAMILVLTCKLPCALLTVLLLYFGRTLIKLFDIPVDLKQGGALLLMALLPMTAVVIDTSNISLVSSKFATYFHATAISAASVFWVLNRKWSLFLFAFGGLASLIVPLSLHGASISQVIVLDLLLTATLILIRSSLTLKKTGIINAIYLSFIVLGLLL